MKRSFSGRAVQAEVVHRVAVPGYSHLLAIEEGGLRGSVGVTTWRLVRTALGIPRTRRLRGGVPLGVKARTASTSMDTTLLAMRSSVTAQSGLPSTTAGAAAGAPGLLPGGPGGGPLGGGCDGARAGGAVGSVVGGSVGVAVVGAAAGAPGAAVLTGPAAGGGGTQQNHCPNGRRHRIRDFALAAEQHEQPTRRPMKERHEHGGGPDVLGESARVWRSNRSGQPSLRWRCSAVPRSGSGCRAPPAAPARWPGVRPAAPSGMTSTANASSDETQLLAEGTLSSRTLAPSARIQAQGPRGCDLRLRHRLPGGQRRAARVVEAAHRHGMRCAVTRPGSRWAFWISTAATRRPVRPALGLGGLDQRAFGHQQRK